MLAFSVLHDAGEVSAPQLARIMYARPAGVKEAPIRSKEMGSFLTEEQWLRMWAIEKEFGGDSDSMFHQIKEGIEEYLADWVTWTSLSAPEKQFMPGLLQNATDIDRLMVLRCLRPDRLPHALHNWFLEFKNLLPKGDGEKEEAYTAAALVSKELEPPKVGAVHTNE